ncbi:MAG: DNA topoisomerase IV subunit A, partial [Alphaproteobacteria bacterium]
MSAETAGHIRPTPLTDALGQRYLSYALSTIKARSLPDVRDGLKPVHRRLLYAMRQLRLDPDQGHKKSARVVGDVIGKFHPHGDQAVYDALVRLAQDFAVRYPLVDGQGNFGSIDGDNAAAMRYTEARLTEVATALLEGIDEDAVDFRATYDGTGAEPAVLPANFPNLLANGATGIAVGMATSIPPHNLGELCEALLHLIKYPQAGVAKLVEFIPGPDLPTGGVLVEDRAAVEEAYASGRGGFRLRARWHAEDLGRGQYQIVVTEIPYQVAKGRLIERVAELLQQRKLPMLADIRDESAEDVRLILEPKSRNVPAEVLMEQLFRQTDLEVRISLNMNVLDADRTPRVMSLREALQAFLDHRHVVLVRRSQHRLARIGERLEVLGGYLIAYRNLDEVIRLIREADDPKPKLMRRWRLSEAQAEAILNMRLRNLRRLEEAKIREEAKALEAEQKTLERLLKDKSRRLSVLASEIREIRARFGGGTALGRRRTEIGAAPEPLEVPVEAFIEREDVTVVCSQKGWVRTIKGHDVDPHEIKYKQGDRARFAVPAATTDKLLVFATDGRFYTIGVEKLPGGRGHGEPLRLILYLNNDVDIIDIVVHEPGQYLLVAASDGRGFVVPEDEVVAQTRGGKQVLNVKGNVEAQACAPVDGDHVAVLGSNRKLVIFPL